MKLEIVLTPKAKDTFIDNPFYQSKMGNPFI